mmetsp:Transcript_76302/g.204992  ORF Transcript_76302/g.204992 Transcript_76302/m.204992 type:complete len:217 (-) Transcript_76302:105-755(-)
MESALPRQRGPGDIVHEYGGLGEHRELHALLLPPADYHRQPAARLCASGGAAACVDHGAAGSHRRGGAGPGPAGLGVCWHHPRPRNPRASRRPGHPYTPPWLACVCPRVRACMCACVRVCIRARGCVRADDAVLSAPRRPPLADHPPSLFPRSALDISISRRLCCQGSYWAVQPPSNLFQVNQWWQGRFFSVNSGGETAFPSQTAVSRLLSPGKQQ